MKIRADKKPLEKEIIENSPEQELLAFVNQCHQDGETYQKKFRGRWDLIEEQIRCVHPSAWSSKEDWQTKVFIPQQSKTSETAQAYLDKMLVGQKRFYSITGLDKKDRKEEDYLAELYDYVLDKGNFFLENDFVFNECCSNTGTSFLKILVKPDRSGLQFIWRSAYNIRFSPNTGHKLSNSTYITDEYKRPLAKMVSDSESGKSIYSKEAIKSLLEKGQEVGMSLTDAALVSVKGFDGTQYQISPEYVNVNLVELWGYVKKVTKGKKGEKDKVTYEDRIVTVANNTVVMRDVENDYGFTPIFGCRVKPRKYDYYGTGFCDNVTDLQELTNSMINLGFDSLKLCSMDIAMVDKTKIADAASIEYRPMATWMFNGNPREAALLSRQGISALGDIMRGLGLLDQFNQEATGVLRQIQGAPDLGGAGGQETLGEYQAKLAMIDNRFLKIGRFIERDYIEPLLKGMFKILFNKKFFNQSAINKLTGMREEEITLGPGIDGKPQKAIKLVPKLDFNKLASAGDICYDFKAVGMTQFSKAIETLQKLKELLLTVVKTPQLMIMSKVDEIYKRVLQAADISDYQELIKSDDEIKQIMEQIYGGVQGGQQAPGGQPPQVPPMGAPQMGVQ